ncbi:MAG: ArnT family glycosyltransferase [Chloroflexota bacterium]
MQSPRLIVCALALAVFLLALAARAPDLNLFPTQDEDNWLERGSAFRAALQRQDWRATYRSGHPGVTTMWLATLGMGDLAQPLVDRTARQVTRVAEFMPALEAARHAMIVFNAGLIALIVLLAGRLVGWAPAIIAGLLLAFEPFFVAHGQVVHLDAPVSGLMAVAMLGAANRWMASGPVGLLVLSAIAGGLAFVTKSPSAFLVLAIPALALIGLRPWGGVKPARRWIIELALWVTLAGITAFAVWPALATTPVETISRMVRFTLAEGGQPHRPGNFFMGQPVADPGPLFYPVALAYRLTPVTLAGLGCLFLVSWWQPRFLKLATPVWALIVLVISFALFMTLGAKKLDRYILPAVPLIDVLAGFGLWTAAVDLSARLRGATQWIQRLPGALLAAAVLLQPLAWQSSLPYPLSYYNTALGGGTAAQRMLLVGWGEGLDQAAAYLNAQPDAASATVGVYYPLTVNFQALLLGTAVSLSPSSTATYVVDYVNARQRGQSPQLVHTRVPDHIVRINGIEYARIYRR